MRNIIRIIASITLSLSFSPRFDLRGTGSYVPAKDRHPFVVQHCPARLPPKTLQVPDGSAVPDLPCQNTVLTISSGRTSYIFACFGGSRWRICKP